MKLGTGTNFLRPHLLRASVRVKLVPVPNFCSGEEE
jgi:hypothetical protein